MLVLVLSDTHAPRHWKGVPTGLRAPLEAAELILHAGDVCTAEVLEQLSAFAPVHAVLGNNDGADVAAWGVPERLELDLEGVRVGMVHDSGGREGRGPRMRRAFPEADVVVFGHSHIPWDTQEPGGPRLFNPGSPTDRRRQPTGTYGWLELADGVVVRHELVPLTREQRAAG